MKFFLRLKHWQLFLFTWGIPLVIESFAFSNPHLLIRLFPLMMMVFIFGIFGWVWAIATVLHEKLPPAVKLNVGRFKILVLIPIVYLLSLVGWMLFGSDGEADSASEHVGIFIAVFLTLHIGSMICILVALRFAAKTMRSVELHRMAKFGDYVAEFFLIWMSPVGIWILQPRLNKLSES